MKNAETTDKKPKDGVMISASEYAEFVTLKAENDELKKLIGPELTSLKDENEELRGKIDWLMEQIALSKKKTFGASSEKSEYMQIDIFNEAEVFSSDEEEAATTQIKGYTRKKKTSELPSTLPDNLPVEIIKCTLPEEDMACGICGYERHEIGSTLARRELEFIPAAAKIKEYWQSSYGCRNCENTGTKVDVVKAEVPKAVIKGSFASPEAIAHIATQKFVMGSPLYRQEQELHRKGIGLSRQTMSNWLVKAAESYLYRIYDSLHEDLKKNDILHADETELQVLKEPGKNAQSKSLWMYRSGKYEKKQVVLFEYTPGRGSEYPATFLRGYKGFMHTDGYSAYRALAKGSDPDPPDIVISGCWAHARRYFTDIVKDLKKNEAIKGTVTEKALEYIGALFKIEDQAKDMSPYERLAYRDKNARMIIDEYFPWCRSIINDCAGSLYKAVNYSLNQEAELRNYLLDGSLDISNNIGENAIRPFCVGRKNWLFCDTPAGAEASATIYSIIETAKANGIDAFEYMEDFMPWSESLPGYCRRPDKTPTEKLAS